MSGPLTRQRVGRPTVKDKPMFDISKKRVNPTAKIDLMEPDGNPMLNDKGEPCSILIFGPASPEWNAANDARATARLKRMEDARGKVSDDLEAAKADDIEFLTAISKEPINFRYGKHDNLADEFRALYADDGLGFIRLQISNAGNGWAAFMQGSATS
jgi:hypothetical protein